VRRDLAIVACAIAAGVAVAGHRLVVAAFLGAASVALTLQGRAARPIPLGLTALIAAFSATTALAFSSGHDLKSPTDHRLHHTHHTHAR
jgi:hypothetical protein